MEGTAFDLEWPQEWLSPSTVTLSPWEGRGAMWGAAPILPNVFQPRPQANFNFLVIMQMNVDLIKGRFH